MVWPMELVRGVSQDAQCLASMLLRRNGGKSHKERLDTFYAPQAQACESLIDSCLILNVGSICTVLMAVVVLCR